MPIKFSRSFEHDDITYVLLFVREAVVEAQRVVALTVVRLRNVDSKRWILAL